MIAAARPDVLLLTGFDWDYDGRALDSLAARLAQAGLDYPFHYAPRPNSGLDSGLDLDGDGTAGSPRDAQGYGRFLGDGGMAILSRLPILSDQARDFSALRWAELPGTLIGGAAMSPEAVAVQRLSTTGHWDVPLGLPSGAALHLFAFAATPPLFDGPEDRNGRRNHDEIAFWQRYLDGLLPEKPAQAPFVLLGDAELDPQGGAGRHAAIAALLADPRLQDPAPRSDGGARVKRAGQGGDPSLDTMDFGAKSKAGGLRLDYVLPSADLRVTGAGVLWPAPADPLAATVAKASRHRLVWVDIDAP